MGLPGLIDRQESGIQERQLHLGESEQDLEMVAQDAGVT